MVVVVNPQTRAEERAAAAPPCARRFALDFLPILPPFCVPRVHLGVPGHSVTFRWVTLLRSPVVYAYSILFVVSID